MVGETAAKVYNFDLNRLSPVVERVGMPVGELVAV
jgi:hypothetical protein